VELQDASLRDLTFPGELKKIFTQVVKARQEGLASLLQPGTAPIPVRGPSAAPDLSPPAEPPDGG